MMPPGASGLRIPPGQLLMPAPAIPCHQIRCPMGSESVQEAMKEVRAHWI